MKISIITVTFNSELYIADCLASVKAQKYHNIEHIVIDGGSTDKTTSIVKKFPHIKKIVSEPDEGIYDAMQNFPDELMTNNENDNNAKDFINLCEKQSDKTEDLEKTDKLGYKTNFTVSHPFKEGVNLKIYITIFVKSLTMSYLIPKKMLLIFIQMKKITIY